MFKPVNRYVQIQTNSEEPQETSSGILLPSDYKPTDERFVKARVLSWADDVRFDESLQEDQNVIVDKTMIEQITFDGRTIEVVLDNYILGLFIA
jgi:co-chaperonin GroES (HSP10)